MTDGDDQPSCVFPSADTILSGQYPLSRPLLITATTRSLERPEVADFLSFYLRRSRTLAAEQRLVPETSSAVATQLGWIATGAYPVFASVDGGPVEVQERPSAPTEDPTRPAWEVPAR